MLPDGSHDQPAGQSALLEQPEVEQYPSLALGMMQEGKAAGQGVVALQAAPALLASQPASAETMAKPSLQVHAPFCATSLAPHGVQPTPLALNTAFGSHMQIAKSPCTST